MANPNEVQIGNYVVSEDTRFTKTYECAAWYRIVLVPAGEYPVFGEVLKDGSVKDTSVVCRLAGTVVSSDLSSYFCGNKFADKRDSDKGEPDSVSVQPYAHALAWNIIREEEQNIALLEQFQAKVVKFTDYTGKECETADIVQV